MKLYYFAGACSLAAHIALREAGIVFRAVRVDPETRRTEDGGPFPGINPRGYVPALVLDDGATLTENVAILDWIAQQAPVLKPADGMERTRLIEILSFISIEIHKPFLAMFFLPGEEAKPLLKDAIASRLAFLAERTGDGCLLGNRFSSADAFLYVMLRWAKGSGVTMPAAHASYAHGIKARRSVQAALRAEGLDSF